MTQAHQSYEVFEEIGRGGDTVVLRGHDLNLGRDVAIKYLLPEPGANPKRREQFLSEAKFLAQFDNPAILRIHSVEPERGWIVMDLMKGSLAAQIRHAALPPATVQSILCQLLPALEFLHGRGKLHGSIRPSNILIDDDGRVKLSDFEESCQGGELRAPTGTKKYLAPELIHSDFGSVGPVTDLYCLGFTALELLLGPKFGSKILTGSSVAIDADVAWLRWHSSTDSFPAASQLVKSLPPSLAQVIDSILQKDVSERLESAAEAATLLGEQSVVPIEVVQKVSQHTSSDATALGEQSMMPASIREIEPPQHVARVQAATAPQVTSSSRARVNQLLEKPYVLYPLCGLILGAALLVGLALRKPKESPLAAAPSLQPLEEVVDQSPALPSVDSVQTPAAVRTPEPELPGIAQESTTVERELSIDDQASNLPEPIDSIEPETDQTALVAEIESDQSQLPTETDALDTILEHPAIGRTELENPKPISPAEPKPMPRKMPRLEFVSTRIDISDIVAEFKGAPELVIDSGGYISEINDVAISPNGKLLAAAGGKVVRVWELASGDLLETLRGDRARTSYGDCNAVEFSRDNQRLVVGVSDYAAHGAIRVYNCDDLSEIESLMPGHTSPVRKIDFSRNGQWMSTADADGHITIWDWAARAIIKSEPPRDSKQPIYDELHFPGDEPVLAGIDFQGPLLMSVPDLTRLSGKDDLPPRTLAWIFDVLTRKLEYPFGTMEDPRNMDLCLGENQWAAAGVGRDAGGNKFWVGVWNARTTDMSVNAKPATVYSQHKWNVTAIDLAPAHQLVASGDKFGEIHVWNSATGKRLHRFKGQGKPIYEAAFDRNSKRIAYGTKSFAPGTWGRNNYAAADKVIDLEKRAIYPIDTAQDMDLVQEQATVGNVQLKVNAEPNRANLSLEKAVSGKPTSRYEFTTGRNPTVYSILGTAKMGVSAPVLVGDNLGLFGLWDSNRDELKRAFIGHDGLVSSISASPTGNMVLSSSADRTLRIWSFDDAKATGKFDFKFENSIVTSVDPGTSSASAGVQVGDRILDIDGKTIAQMHRMMLEGKFDYSPGQVVPVRMQRRGAAYTFDMQLQEGYDFADPILSIYIGDEGQWIIWTPRGYYDASPGAEQLIGWHINRGPDKSAAYFQVQQFRDHLYRPDIINRILGGARTDQAIEAANTASPASEVVDFRSPSDLALRHPPEVLFLSPRSGGDVQGGQVQLQAQVISRNGLPIREVTLLVNGVASEVLTPLDSAAQTMDIDMSVQLKEGRNNIELIAANAEATSFAQSVYVNAKLETPLAPAVDVKSRLNVLAIGISDYAASAAGFQDLPLASSDAEQFIATVGKQAGGKLYDEVQSRSLIDRQASRTAILDGLQWLVDSTEPGDTIAIFVSAHGFVDSTKNFYIGTHDVDMQRPRSTAISWREFIQTLHADLPSCRRLLFLDLHPTEQAVSPDIRNPLLDLAAPEMATIFFSSNSLQQSSLPTPAGTLGYSAGGLNMVLADDTADVEPEQPDQLLNAGEISRAWTKAVRTMSHDQFYPVSFSPEKSKELTVFQLQQ